MWGFACDSAVLRRSARTRAWSPCRDRRCSVPPGDTTLTINLTNNLPVPVSIVIPGLDGGDDAGLDGRHLGPEGHPGQRVRSFTHEAASGGTSQYVWNGVGPGTYLYQSGTQPQVQVQMGLYGALSTKPAAAGLAYDGVAYDLEHVLLFSEIDPGTARRRRRAHADLWHARLSQHHRLSAQVLPRQRRALHGGDRLPRRAHRGQSHPPPDAQRRPEGARPTILESHWDVVAEGGRPYRITAGATSTARSRRSSTRRSFRRAGPKTSSSLPRRAASTGSSTAGSISRTPRFPMAASRPASPWRPSPGSPSPMPTVRTRARREPDRVQQRGLRSERRNDRFLSRGPSATAEPPPTPIQATRTRRWGPIRFA